MASHGHCVVVCRLTPLLRSIGCVVFEATAGVETRRVHREGVPGAEPVMDHCVVDKRKHKTNNQLERRHSRSLGPLQQKRRDKQAINRFEVCRCILWLEAENHAAIVFTPPPTGERSIVMRVSVCVCVCVCVCLSAIISSELHVRSSPYFCACYLSTWLGSPLAAW